MDLVIVAHGWLAGPWQMRRLLEHLSAAGFDAVAIGYPTALAQFSIAVERARIAARAAEPAPLHLIGYSYGGLVMRALAAEAPPGLVSLLLIATPNGGSRLADLACRVAPTPVLRRLKTDARLPLPPAGVRVGCIAGSRSDTIGRVLDGPNDGKVTVASALAVPHDDARVLPIRHAALPGAPEVARLAVDFLRRGHF
jgi:pimeloyl-ACP methyl ester carboxylesterase